MDDSPSSRKGNVMSGYLEYLDSPEWWAQRKAALIRACYRCEREMPGGPRHLGVLEVHHRTYRGLGDENVDDLEVLCSGCHRNEHLPQNLKKRMLEWMGQMRLFDRWDPEPDPADSA